MRKIFLTTLTTLMLLAVAAVAFAADGEASSSFGLAAAGIASARASAVSAPPYPSR